MRSEDAIKEVVLDTTIDLSSLSQERLEDMAAAGAEVLEVHRVLSKTGDNIVGDILRDQGTFFEWNHYPKGDVYDHETHGQFYYHAHAGEQRFDGEHGHFHTFVRGRGMPSGVKPAKVADYTPAKDVNDELSHIIAISMNPAGFPFRLFTVNRWVTAETWYEGSDVCKLLDHFQIDHTRPSWPVNCWVSAMVRLYRPQIEALIAKRDRTIAHWQSVKADTNIFEDRSIEVTSYLDIDLQQDIQAVGQAMAT